MPECNSRWRMVPIPRIIRSPMQLRRAATSDLSPAELGAVRRLLDAAFSAGDVPLDEWFTDHDWEHALGGVHVLGSVGGRLVAHGSVVGRRLHAGDRPLEAGYVEAVGVEPGLQRTGLGSTLMREINDVVRESYELGALGTGSPSFYTRLGWEVWAGPTYVQTDTGRERTADEDGGILILRTARTPALDLTDSLTCEWRPGDVW